MADNAPDEANHQSADKATGDDHNNSLKEDGTEKKNTDRDARERLRLTIRLSSGAKFDVELEKKDNETISTSVLDVKLILSTKEETGNCEVSRQRLIYKGRILEDARSLSDYGIVNRSTLFLVKGKKEEKTTMSGGGGDGFVNNQNDSRIMNDATSSSVTAAASGSNPRPTTSAQQPSLLVPPAGVGGGGSGSMVDDILRSLSADGGAGGGGGGDMNDMMQSPLMRGMLNNPEIMRQMMQSQMQNNPAMRELMQNNPMMQQIMNDPAAWDQAMQMMRNPAAMQQAMRQQDLALSQLENLPGGMAALQNMYLQYQQPLEDALGGGNGGSSMTASSSATTGSSTNGDAGAAGRAMPNPWGSPQSTRSSSSSSSASAAPTNSRNPWGIAANSGGGGGSNNPWGGSLGGGGGVGGSHLGMMPSGLQQQSQGAPSREQRQQMLRMLESNPAMLQSMERAYEQNPQLFREMIMQQNPMVRQMFQQNPAAADAWIRSMMNPNTMRTMMQMEDALRGINLADTGGSGGSSGSGSSDTGAIPATPPLAGGLDFGNLLQQQQQSSPPFVLPDLASLWGGLGGVGNPATAAARPGGGSSPQRSVGSTLLSDQYRRQLQALADMGFDDEIRNLDALRETTGNVNRAVDLLLSGAIPSSATTTADREQPVTTSPSSVSSGDTADAAGSNGEDSPGSIDTTSGEDADRGDGGPPQPTKDAEDKKND